MAVVRDVRSPRKDGMKHEAEFGDRKKANHGRGQDHRGDQQSQRASRSLSTRCCQRVGSEHQRRQIEEPVFRQLAASQERRESAQRQDLQRLKVGRCRMSRREPWVAIVVGGSKEQSTLTRVPRKCHVTRSCKPT
jgi:hypothetical protein